MIASIQHKWDKIYRGLEPDCLLPIEVLIKNDFLLPATGNALDLASGLGANAIFLANKGLAVTAYDISIVAINKLKAYAAQQGLDINACHEKIVPKSFSECAFDVIVVSRFLDRTLSDAIIGALKPDGLLFYQTFTREKITPTPPNNLDYLLIENELLRQFSSLRVILYRENALVGDLSQGLRNEAQFVGQKQRQLVEQ